MAVASVAGRTGGRRALPLCALTNVRWCDIHDSHYAAWKDFSNDCVRARERERVRLNGLDGDNFRGRDWKEVIP